MRTSKFTLVLVDMAGRKRYEARGRTKKGLERCLVAYAMGAWWTVGDDGTMPPEDKIVKEFLSRTGNSYTIRPVEKAR